MLSKKEIASNRKVLSDVDRTMAAAFKVLSDVNRYRIFRILAQQPKLAVSDIALILGISLPLASQHIRVLERANLLQKERIGKKIVPRLEHGNPLVQVVAKTIQEALKYKELK